MIQKCRGNGKIKSGSSIKVLTRVNFVLCSAENEAMS